MRRALIAILALLALAGCGSSSKASTVPTTTTYCCQLPKTPDLRVHTTTTFTIVTLPVRLPPTSPSITFPDTLPSIPSTVTPIQTPNGNGATALCNDGSYSYSQHHSGTCSHHGGVAVFYK